MKFKFKIFNDRLTQEEYKNGVSGNVNTYTCNFDIECSYGGLTWFCVFKQGDNVYSVPIIDGECIMPYEVVESKGRIYIGAYGTNTDENNIKRVSTNWLFLRIDEGAYSEGSVPDVPTADAWEVYVNSKVEPLLKEIETSENQRQTAENNRLSAENNRKTAESNRQTAEDGRATAESERATAETQRLNAEANRNSYETERILAETARVEAENTRADAEAQRALSESERQSAEAERVMTELARAEAETARVSAENARVEAEAARAEELAKKADKATTLEGYGIIDAYTKTEVDDKDNAIKSDIEALKQKSIPHTTASDYPLTVTDHLEGEDVINYQVYGNSTQATRSGKNILPYPYKSTTHTYNGITWTDNGDGTIIANGTATDGDGYFYVTSNSISLDSGQQYMISGCPSGGIIRISINNEYYDVTDENYSLSGKSNIDAIYLIIAEGTTVSKIIFKPQIEEGTTATEYEQYGVMPSPDYPSEIQSVGDLVSDTTSEYYGKYDVPVTVCGKNLIPYPYSFTTKTINGVTFTDNGDGSITIDGTATANALFYLVAKQDNYTLDKCGLKIGDRYTISKTLISGDSIANVYFTANYNDKNGSMKQGALASSANTATSKIQSDFKSWGIYLLVAKDKTVNNTTIKLQLEKGSSATEYEPYRGIETTHIYLDEPLRKVGDYADYIDYKNQKVVRCVDVLDDTGTKNISESYVALATPTEEAITAPDFDTSNSEVMNVSSGTVISPSSMDVTYYQDINKVITELKNAILAQGGNV